MSLVTIDKSERVGIVTLNRPEKRNALSPELVAELLRSFDSLARENDVKIIILKSSSEVFCAGADLAYLKQLQHNSYEENLADSRNLMELFRTMYEFPKPIIAQVEGHAIAGGSGLAVVCDFVFAVPEAKFGFTEVKIGFIPAIVSVILMRKTNEAFAREMLLTGDLYPSEHVYTMGLINKVLPADQMAEHVMEFALRLARQNSGESMRLTKSLFDTLYHLPLSDAFEQAAASNAQSRGTADCRRGIKAFLDKEKIAW
jgi:methylglutaconyl-CoA hydratase